MRVFLLLPFVIMYLVSIIASGVGDEIGIQKLREASLFIARCVSRIANLHPRPFRMK